MLRTAVERGVTFFDAAEASRACLKTDVIGLFYQHTFEGARYPEALQRMMDR